MFASFTNYKGCTDMSMRTYAFAVGAAALLGVQAVQAQPVNGCPPGQAMQSSSPSGNTVTCVPIPDATALRAAIDAEAQVRSTADTALSGEISELRAKMEEQSITGRWAFTGPQNCLSSSTGFNTTLQPIFVAGVTVLSTSATAVSGVRIFGAPDAAGKGTGTASATFHTITHPTFLSPPPAPPAASPFRTGSAAITALQSAFSYEIQGENVIIDDGSAVGQIVKGSPGTIQTIGNPRFFGKISKDRRTILLAQEDLVVEQSVFTPPAGTPFTTDRVCWRERTLIKLDQ
jgi:hypothetical protein